MKTFTIALNTLTRSFRSAFALVFMFAIPLLMAGMFSLMFGGSGNPAEQAAAPEAQQAHLTVVNLDRGDPLLASYAAALTPAETLGGALVQELGSESYSSLLQVSPAQNTESAIQAVLSGQADAALVIPVDFSAAYVSGRAPTDLQLYRAPNRPTQTGLVEAVLSPLIDSLSGSRIAVQVANAQAAANGSKSPLAGQIVTAYAQTFTEYEASQDSAQPLVDTQTLSGTDPQAATPLSQIVAPILGGMMIFFAFFTGCNTALGILHDQENGTLARLFSTPTALSSILGGKFAAVGLTVLVQVCVLLVAGRLIFSIEWGSLPSVIIAALGAVVCATSFGIFTTALLKNIRQASMVFGGLLTVTGMLGIIGIFTGSGSTPLISLFTPQGWAIRGLQLAMNGAEAGEIAGNLLVLLALSLVFFIIGRLLFQKRFA
jgi:ABC-2 type transport system permease protein